MKPMDLPNPVWLPSLGWPHAYPHGLVGLEAVHVVGSPKAPGGEELEEVDFHRCLHKHDVVGGQPKAVGKAGEHIRLTGVSLDKNHAVAHLNVWIITQNDPDFG